eukprot:6509896-Lingulodinium_polyedra.AAC.1
MKSTRGSGRPWGSPFPHKMERVANPLVLLKGSGGRSEGATQKGKHAGRPPHDSGRLPVLARTLFRQIKPRGDAYNQCLAEGPLEGARKDTLRPCSRATGRALTLPPTAPPTTNVLPKGRWRERGRAPCDLAQGTQGGL